MSKCIKNVSEIRTYDLVHVGIMKVYLVGNHLY